MMVEIIEYTDKWQPAFKQLNLEWLNKYNLCEEADLIVLNNPVEAVLNKGGVIYLAKSGDEIIGSAALINEGHHVYELAKMSVTEQWQGRGISKRLMDRCLAKARELGAVKIELYSNHQLKPALKLYEQYGFMYIEVKDSPFETADIKMELTV
ncbi:MAG: GNAT family N-acetyltransferase [Chitinophagaceae bacterium]|jgi:putative acetyltransferase|nr:GNAT family N-acetyltransferase [Chitinophagaceae bacterium]